MNEKQKERFELLLEEIRDRIRLVLEGHDAIRSEMKQMESGIKEEIKVDNRRLEGKIEAVHSSLKKEAGVTARAAYDLLIDVRNDVKEVKGKLEEHVRLLHPA